MVRRCLPVLLLVAVAAAEEVTADLAWRATDRRQYKPVTLKLAPEPPEGGKALEKVEAPLYGRRPLGDRHLLVAADFTAGAWKLWIDRDFDGDLNDEEPVSLGPSGHYGSRTVPLQVDGDESIDVYFYKYTSDTRPRIHVIVFAHREGTVILEGRVRKLALYDRDGDLRFDGATDLFFLDVNGDSRLDRGTSSFERIVVGKPFRLRDRGYVAQPVRPTAGQVVFRRVDPAPPPATRVWRANPIPPTGVTARPGKLTLKDLKARYKSGRALADENKWRAVRAQQAALAQVGNLGTKEAFQFLLRTYRTARSPEVRAAAVRAMGYRDYVEYAPKTVLIARKAKEVPLRVAAMESLHRMNAPDRAAVYAEIFRRATEEQECTIAARYLAWTRTGTGYEALREAVTKLPRLGHRYGAYLAATRYRKRPPAPDLVLAAARGVDPRLRNLGLRDAFYLGLPETRLLALECARAAKTDVALQMAVTETLAAYADPEAIGALLPLAESASPTLRGRLIDLLRPVRAEASVAALVAGLEWRSPDVRALVAEILIAIPTRQVKEALAARLVEERHEPALTALLRAAGRLRLVAAAPAIVAAAERGRDDEALQQTALRALGRIGLADSVVLEFFTERARSFKWEERLIVLDAAAESGDPRAAPLLLKALADDVWQVRLTVVQGLARVRVKDAVPALIARLEQEEMKRIKRAIGETLFKLTGQSYFDLPDLWKRWWEEYGEGFVIPAEIPERKERKDGRRTVATFYGVPVESDRVVFVLDHSGSMGSKRTEGGTEFDKAVAETLKVAAKLEKGAKLNVILFESEVTRWKKKLVPVTRRSRAALKGYLENKSERGSTNLYDALEMALLTKDVDSIYLLSDGSPNQGKFVRHDDILRAVRQLNRVRRITIHCIALGYASDLLQELAAQSGGTYARR
ncbi:MAG: HEAT repeat domain-containing protein [Planctomycetota bacterium]|jgi:HEAT repeat protein